MHVILSDMDQEDSSLRALVVIPGRGMCTAGFTGYAAPRAVFLPVVLRPQMLVITAGMDQKECYVSPCRKLRIFRSCSSSQVVDLSCCGAEVDSHGLAVQQTVEILQLLLYMWSMHLVCCSSWFPCRGAEAVSHGPDLLRRGCVSRSRLFLDQEIPQLLDTVIDFPVAQVVQFVFFVVARR